MQTMTEHVVSLQRRNFSHSDAFLRGVEWGRHDRRPMHEDDWEYFSWLRTQYGFARVVRPRVTTPQGANPKLDGTTAAVVGLTLQSHKHRMRDGRLLHTCPKAGRCVNPCVGGNGNGMYPAVQKARDARTEYAATEPNMFFFHVGFEVGRELRKHGIVEFRPKVNDDMDWGKVCPSVGDVSGLFAYGYTKLDWPRFTLSDDRGFVEAYSLNEASQLGRVRTLLEHGYSVAAVTNRKKGQPVEQWAHKIGLSGVKVVEADVEDDWMLTAAKRGEAVIGDLTAKGKARSLARTEQKLVRQYPNGRMAHGRFIQQVY